MRPTREAIAAGAVGVVLSLVGVGVASVVPVVGGALVFGAVLGGQARTAAAFRDTVAGLDVTVAPEQPAVPVETPTTLTVQVSRPPDAADIGVSVVVPTPVGADPISESERTLDLSPGDTAAEGSISVSFPVAGRYTLPRVKSSLVGSMGLFTETVRVGPETTLTVEPEQPSNVHLGKSGRRFGVYGEHQTEHGGEGLTPTGHRKYVSGDPASRIDWKATARLQEVYLTEFDIDASRRVHLLVDHRSRTDYGADGRRVLDVLREAALSVAVSVEATGDPIGLIGIGDDGLTRLFAARRTPEQNLQIRAWLQEVRPTSARAPSSSGLRNPETARRVGDLLANDTSAFARRVRPFVDESAAYIEPIERNPLYAAIERVRKTSPGDRLYVVLTDDRDRETLIEALRFATRGGDSALVLLAPTALFEPNGLADLDGTYERYVEFESFRRRLEEQTNVTALEVAPADRISAVLKAGGSRPEAGAPQPDGGVR